MVKIHINAEFVHEEDYDVSLDELKASLGKMFSGVVEGETNYHELCQFFSTIHSYLDAIPDSVIERLKCSHREVIAEALRKHACRFAKLKE